MAPAPIKPAFCGEQQRLIIKFRVAATAYLQLEARHLQAVVNGEESNLEDAIKAARGRKDAAKQAVTAHQQEHGC